MRTFFNDQPFGCANSKLGKPPGFAIVETLPRVFGCKIVLFKEIIVRRFAGWSLLGMWKCVGRVANNTLGGMNRECQQGVRIVTLAPVAFAHIHLYRLEEQNSDVY